MDGELIKKALCFHGKPMQKIWDDERGVGDLQAVGVPEDGNYNIYMERQKYFTFQDRAKRLKLHQFLARKAGDLYDKELGKIPAKPAKLVQDVEDKNASIVADLPPYESFLNKHQDKVKRHTLESIKTGDIVYASVLRSKCGSLIPIMVKPLCTEESNFKLLRDFKIKTLIPAQLTGSPLLDKSGNVSSIEANDFLRCEVVEFSIDAERMTLSLEPISDKNKNKKLGKITPEELPQLYGILTENTSIKYEDHLIQAKELDNPNYDILYAMNGLDVNDNFTLMSNLKNGFPVQEYAKELRQIQASKWAFRSVAEGIEYFKVGQHVEAFQCLNKALNIDPRNVEGLVARGALYANKGSFLKAVEDFEKALKLNAYHVNARKYMGETLVALGRSYEEDNRIQDAAKAYRDCLNIIPNHEQAGMLLEAIQQRTGASVDILPSTGKIYDHLDIDKASSASNGSDSEDSTSDSGSDSDEDTVSSRKKEGSLSPLSKKLALHAQELEAASRNQQFSQPFYMSQATAALNPQAEVFPNEFRLDEDDTESRVRKLLQDASKHKKDKKKTKKSKKSKKSKKGSKTAKDLIGKNIPVDVYKYSSKESDLQSAETALNANLKLYEKSIELLRKRQELFDQPTTSFERGRKRQKSISPPPAPSFRPDKVRTGGVTYHTVDFGKFPTQAASSSRGLTAGANELETHKFSFQIKKPVKFDKFGLVRLATPVLKRSPTPSSPSRRVRKRLPSRSRSRSRSRRRSRSRSRTRSRSGGRRRRWQSRSRSTSRGRYVARRRRRSTSRTRSSSRSDSYTNRRRRDSRSISRDRGRRSLSRDRGRRSLSRDRGRRSPSPFGRRRSPSPRRPYKRSHSRSPQLGGKRGRGVRGRGSSSTKFGNRVWKNPNSAGSPKSRKPSSSDDRWPHDKFENPGDDPTIEEIDEIISKAQRERKQNIINNDKDILKKPNKW